MSRNSKKYLLLFLILAFSFIYRVLLILRVDFPPGADIGLHNSVIHSITPSGNVDFLWNNYQMGGGLSLTFPGYHILVSQIILVTGLPDYLAHTFTVALFSTLIVACAFLITRKLWMESTAFIVAFLVAVSRFDVEMLLWGGYPNVITLMLIPLLFYLYLQRERFSLSPFLATATLLSGALFLTHSLSAVVFVSTTLAIVIFALIFSKKVGLTRKRIATWVAPIFLGGIVVSPFLIDAVPAYLGANSGTFTGGVSDIRLALLSTRVLPLDLIVPLSACVVLFFLFSKEYKGKFLTVSALMLVLWIIVPVAFTQGYLVGFYIDYNRFLYFVLLPVIILIGLAIDHLSTFFSRLVEMYLSFTKQTWQANKTASRLVPYLTRKNTYGGIVIVSLLFAFFSIPLFLTPLEGIAVQSYYQVMNNPGYDAIQWAQRNTPTNAVFVSDALYGWWFSGFAQRPTLSAVDPQYLTLSREFEPAKAAKSLLDTDYIIDNGLVQVREDGGYIGRHNPMFLAKLNWTYFPYPFLQFNNSVTTIKYRVGDDSQSYDLDQLAVKEMRIENDPQHATITVKKGNAFINYTQLTTVYSGTAFANMSIIVESTVEGVHLEYAQFILNSKGTILGTPQKNTIALLDEGVKAFGQLIFTQQQPKFTLYKAVNPCLFSLEYDLQDKPKQEIQLSIGVYSVSDSLDIYQNEETKGRFFNPIISSNVNSLPKSPNSSVVEVFDYQGALVDWNISYIAVRDSEIIPKFACDPAFSLLFINDEVAIFMVK